jgi:hypothetical protein
MFFPTNYYNQILLTTIIVSFVLITYLIVLHQKMKVIENNKLLILFNELELEKKNSKQLKKIPQTLKLKEKETHQKIQNIKVNVMNIGFSLNEIFK